MKTIVYDVVGIDDYDKIFSFQLFYSIEKAQECIDDNFEKVSGGFWRDKFDNNLYTHVLILKREVI
jgi:hypothetical protein